MGFLHTCKQLTGGETVYYTICPHCGYKLLKAENGTKIELFCPKCKEKLSIAVKDGVVIIGKYELKDTIIL